MMMSLNGLLIIGRNRDLKLRVLLNIMIICASVRVSAAFQNIFLTPEDHIVFQNMDLGEKIVNKIIVFQCLYLHLFFHFDY